MKKYIYGLIFLLGMAAPRMIAQSYHYEVTKKYKISRSTTVDIYNKYGKIHVISWEKDSVLIRVSLNINSSEESKLKKLKNSIDFDFTGTSYYVNAKTVLGSDNRGFFTDVMDLAGKIISTDNNVTIDYLIMIPSYAHLKLENKFGDIYVDDITGSLNVTLANGDLKANRLRGKSTINLNTGDGVINYIKDGKINIAYSTFEVKDADKLIIDSRSSNINIDHVNYIKANSRRDKFYLPSIADLYGESYFSDFNITNLSHELNFNFRYGDLTINLIDKHFSFININSEYTDLDLIFASGAVYDIDVTHSEEVVLTYPVRYARLQDKVINEDQKQMLTFGTIGYGKPTAKVQINAPTRKCVINIIHK
jgi:hypothetical protein